MIRYALLPLVFTAILVTPALAQEGEDPSPEEQAWMESMTPGEHHAAVMERAGTYEVTSKFWMDPTAPPMESTGTSTFTPMLGGRYLRLEYQGDMGGMPFEGFGIDGFDNLTGKHRSFWVDSFGTSFYLMEGACEEDHTVITQYGEWPEPATGGTMLVKAVTTVKDADSFTYEMYVRYSEDEEWYRNMELTYTRQKKE